MYLFPEGIILFKCRNEQVVQLVLLYNKIVELSIWLKWFDYLRLLRIHCYVSNNGWLAEKIQMCNATKYSSVKRKLIPIDFQLVPLEQL